MTFAQRRNRLRTYVSERIPVVNRLTPNDPYRGRTAQLTSRRCILYIHSTNIRTEYFKHAAHSPFFSLQNALYFITLRFWFLYYSHFIYRVCKNLKENSGAKVLSISSLLYRLRLEPAACHLLELRVRFPPVAWMTVCCACCVLSGR